MASLIGADENAEESVFASDESIPVWARSGVAAMRTLGIFDADEGEDLTAPVTRANIAEYLYRLNRM